VSPHADDLHVEIIDKGHSDKAIGNTTITTSDIMASDNMEMPLQSFNLKNAGTGGKSTIKMAVNVRCLKRPQRKSTKLTDAIKKPEIPAEISKPEKPEENSNEDKVEVSENPKVLEKKMSVQPSLPEMVENTMKPIAEAAGIDFEAQLRRRDVTVGPGKVKLSAQYNPVRILFKLLLNHLPDF